jgi:thioredoxin reductase (NADPH)
MSTRPSSSIFETRKAQLFPILDAHQIEELVPFGTRRHYATGDVLFAEGERHVGSFVILAGSVDIFRHVDGQEELIVTHSVGGFSGEVGLFSGRGAIVTGRAHEETDVLVVREADLRRLIVTHPELGEILMRAFILRRVAMLEDEKGGVTLVGSRLSSDTHRLRQFLERNAQPHTYYDLDRDAETAGLLTRFGVRADDLPVAITFDGTVLRRPSNRELAAAIGLGPEPLDGRRFDVAVIGAGPAGLAAAVYAASEGLSVIVLDARAPGGQAGSTSRIENYFGFPNGITGQALAGRGFVQAEKFGAEVAIPREAVGFECQGERDVIVKLDSRERIAARSVVVASGARYRKLRLPDLERYEGRGIYYSASFMEAKIVEAHDAIVVGGGNSAGQAIVFLAQHGARRVHVLVRSASLDLRMSSYLVDQIQARPNVTVHTEHELVKLCGDGVLEGVRWRDNRTGAEEDRDIEHVFLFCGADPNTAWLEECLTLDTAGFVKTGRDLTQEELREAEWPLARAPMRLETSHPGVFAVGDVRSGSVKRCAAAVGEGSTAIQLLHTYLGEKTDAG